MSAEQLSRATLKKTLATTSLPEYVATHSPKTDYLAPFRTRQYVIPRAHPVHAVQKSLTCTSLSIILLSVFQPT